MSAVQPRPAPPGSKPSDGPRFLVASEDSDSISLSLVSLAGAETLTRVGVTAGFHLAVHPVLPVAYLTSGADGGSVVAVSLAGAGEVLARVGGIGAFPCHLALSPDGSALATADYESGSVAFVALRDGVPVSLASNVDLPYAARPGADERQDSAHPHACHWLPDGAVLVPDLGADVVWRVEPASGRTTAAYRCPAGSGPRHLARDPSGRLWVSLELSSRAGLTGDDMATAPATATPARDVRNYPGDIVAAGPWIVMANRGADTLAVYDGRSATPELAAELPSGGVWPAGLAVAGDVLAVALRDSDQVGFFAVAGSGPEPGLTLSGTVGCGRPISVAAYR